MIRLLPLLLLILIVVQCAPKRKVFTEEGELTKPPPCTPERLIARAGYKKVILRWDTNCPRGVILSGYNIYLITDEVTEEDLRSNYGNRLRPYNAEPYPGDTEAEGQSETMTIDNLQDGKEFYFSVRTVFPDGTMSEFSNLANAVCRPEGEFVLAYRYSGTNDGFSFSKGKAVRADASANDIYFFQKDGIDFIASPARLNGFLRKSQFFSLGKTSDIYQHPKFEIDIPPEERLPVMPGESYLIKTADGNFAKIRIEQIAGQEKERTLRIRYIYQTIKGLIRF